MASTLADRVAAEVIPLPDIADANLGPLFERHANYKVV
jgi:hypothetical protein